MSLLAQTYSELSSFLQIRNLVKEFDGYKAVDHVNLDIARGEIFGLLGSSGSGKSTLLRMLAGFETPTQGQIILNGEDLANKLPYERPLNMMFQSYALFPHLTVWDNIAFGLKRDSLPKNQIADRVEAMLKLVQMTKFGQRKPHQLSGGQQQRVALARSLAKKPQLLLLDEPLGALDKKLREETQIELVHILKEVQVTCVIVTHDQEEAMTMASRIAVMNEGRFQQVAPPAEIYETPANRFVADFIGNVNLMEGQLIEDEEDHALIECADCKHYVGHGITGSLGMTVTVALRPEKIRISQEEPDAPKDTNVDSNCVKGVIKNISYFGSFTLYHVCLPSGKIIKVSQGNTERHSDQSFKEGDSTWLSWSRNAHVVLTV
jgi:putrescine transport system ATP-binding protein